MYLKLVILNVVFCGILTSSRSLFPCDKKSGNTNLKCLREFHNAFFKILSDDLSALEDSLQVICDRSEHFRLREIVDASRYHLLSHLQGYSEEDFEIKINGSVLSVTANNGTNFVAKMVILPRFVDTAKGLYYYDAEMLKIAFPINTPTDVCDRGTREGMRTVRKFGTLFLGWPTELIQSNLTEHFEDPDNNKLLTSQHPSGFAGIVLPDLSPCESNHSLDLCMKRWSNAFTNLSTSQIMLDQRMKEACILYSNGRLREVVEETHYKLTTHLSGYSEDDFEIKVFGSILYFSAKNKHMYNAQFVILPRFVNIKKGSYYHYYNSTLDIVFPRKNLSGVCTRSFRKAVKIVPKFLANK